MRVCPARNEREEDEGWSAHGCLTLSDYYLLKHFERRKRKNEIQYSQNGRLDIQ